MQKKSYPCREKGQALAEYFNWKAAGDKGPLIMAHRNSPPESGIAENSITAMENAYSLNSCMIQEIDVRMTRDSQLVLMHDTTIDRTTTGKGKVTEILYEDLRQYRLKDKAGTILKDHVPLLDEVLQSAGGRIIFALDMKPGTDAIRLMNSVKKFNAIQNVFVICYSIDQAQQLIAAYPDVMVALGFNSWENITSIEKSGLPYKNLIALTPWQIQEQKFYDKIHGMGIMFSFGAFANTDKLSRDKAIVAYKKIRESGADIISTDSVNNVINTFY